MEQSRSFGAWLKQRRRALDLTQHTLATQVGCTAETIRKIEANKLRPSRTLAQRLTTALRVSPDLEASVLELARARQLDEPSSANWLVPMATKQVSKTVATLPIPRTALVGREGDIAQLTVRLRDPTTRLVTLTGPPGVGKTRLALEVAALLGVEHTTHVHFVMLAALHDPGAVMLAIARSLNLAALHDDPEQEVIAVLRERSLLLVLDNMEHLRTASRQLGLLLDKAPRLTMLVTSRTPLHLSGEQVWSVAPLPVHQSETTSISSDMSPAVELFVQRARAVQRNFVLDEHTAPVIATICARLDGLPLAIELAAARSATLSPQALLRRLEHHLDLLTIGPVDVDMRHQTLRHAIAWSYQQLDVEERALLRCLSVFKGGCRLELIQAVHDQEAIQSSFEHARLLVHQPSPSLLDQLTVLVEHSLLEQHSDPDGEPRFTLLATIQAFAHEQAEIAGEVASLHDRHLRAYTSLAEAVEPQLHGPAQQHWFVLLDHELHNLRAALTWSQEQADDGMLGMRLATALATFWEVRGLLHEGRLWLQQALTADIEAPAPLKALALARAAHLATAHGDVPQAKILAETCLAIADGVGERVQAIALGTLGLAAHVEGVYERAQEYFTASLQLARSAGDRVQQTLMLERLGKLVYSQGSINAAAAWFEQCHDLSEQHGNVRGVMQALNWQGLVALNNREYERAATLLEESLAQARALNYKRQIGTALLDLGELARLQGQYLQAASYYEQSCSIWQEVGQRGKLAVATLNLGHVALHQEDAARALAAFGESMTICHEVNYHEGIALALAGCAGALRLRGEMTAATQLLAAATTLRDAIGAVFETTDQAAYDRDLAAIRLHLDDAIFQAAWREGAALPLKQAVAEAHARIRAAQERQFSQSARFPADLTPRELEVLQLLTHGLTNVEIAERLIISPRTVNTHINAIYRKLDVKSRSAATRFAVERGLI